MARGFTLLEVLFVMVAAAILLTLGLPSFQNSIRNSHLTASVNEMVASLQLARSEAVKRRIPVVICTSSDAETCDPAASWHQGWIVFADADDNGAITDGDQLIRGQASLRHGVTVRTPDNQPLQNNLSYAATGFPELGGLDAAGFMIFCDQSKSNNFGRVIAIPQTGRPQAASIKARPDLKVSCE